MAEPDTDLLERTEPPPVVPETTTAPVTTRPAEIEPPARVSTPAPPRPPSAAEEMYPRFKEEVEGRIEESKKAQTDLVESQRRYTEAARHRIEATQPEREAEIRDIDEQQKFLREHPREPPAALPERPKLRYDLADLFGPKGQGPQMMQAISVLAAVSGGTMQERLLFALTAFNGMVKGWAQGKTDDFNQRYKEWQDQVETIRDTETRKRQYINDTLNDRKISADLRDQKLKLQAFQDQDAMSLELLNQKNIVEYDKFGQQQYNLFKDAMKEALDFDKAVEKRQVDALMEQPGIRFAAESAIEGNYTQLRTYRAGSPERKAAENIVAQIAAQQGLTQQDLINRQATFAGTIAAGRAKALAPVQAGAATLRQLEQNRAAIDQAEQTALSNLDVLVDRTRAVDKTGIPVIERLRREGLRALGDNDVYAFYTALKIVEPEVARILVNPRLVGQLTDSARREAQTFMDTGMSLSNLLAVRRVLVTDFNNRRQANETQLTNEIERVRSGLTGGTTTLPAPAEPYVAPGPPASIGTYEEWLRTHAR